MLSVHGLAPCQAGTLQLTLPVYFLKRRPSTPSQLMGCGTRSAHACVYFHWVLGWGGNCNSALNLDFFFFFYILCHQRDFLSSFIDHFSQDFIMDNIQQANNKLFKVDLSADDGSLVFCFVQTKLSCRECRDEECECASCSARFSVWRRKNSL